MSFRSLRALAAAALLLGTAGAASAATLTVPSLQFPTIQSAIDAAFPGDTVLVKGGTYEEVLNVPVNLTGLILRGKGKVLIDARVAGADSGSAIVVAANIVTIRNLRIRHPADDGITGGDGIRVTGNQFTARDVVVEHAEAAGIRVTGDDATLIDCTAKGCDQGFIVTGARATLVRARAELCADAGIEVNGVDAVLNRPFVRNGGNGIEVTGAGANLIRPQVRNAQGDGIAVNGSTATLDRPQAHNCDGTGLVLSGNGAEADRAILTNCGVGAAVSGNDALLRRARVEDCESGATVTGNGSQIIDGKFLRIQDDAIAISGTGCIAGDNQIQDVGGTGVLVQGSVSGTIVVNNSIRYAGELGIHVDQDDDVDVIGNQVRECGDGDGAGIQIVGNMHQVVGNQIRQCPGDGLRLEGDGNSLSANTARDNLVDGIDVESGDANSLSNNVVMNNGAEGFENNGTNTAYQSNNAKGNRIDFTNDGTLGAFNFNLFTTGGIATAPQID